jgi:hypothetical protein
MTVPKQKLNYFRKLQLEQIKHLKEHVDAYRSRVASVALRKEILEKQNVRNFQSEYERIRAHMEDSSVPFKTREGLQARAAHLKALGAKAVGSLS